MGRTLAMVTFSFLFACSASAAVDLAQFDPGHYGDSDGALLMDAAGNYVEPYFATKALIAAQDAGADVRSAALAWIRWVLPRQRLDGRIGPFCRKTGNNWYPCGDADADDSMLALWLQLLYRQAPASGLPAEWQESAARSRRYLESLRNSRLGIYHVSRRNHVGLFMDNVEVYCALREIAAAERRFGDPEQAARTDDDAARLAAAIQHIFWNKRAQLFRVSTQKRAEFAFYPDAVAQTFALMSDLPSPAGAAPAWSAWVARFGTSWLYRKQDPHPWGLIALAALHAGDDRSTVCWLSRAAPLRYSPMWNILEEAAFQALQDRFRAEQLNPSACAQVPAK